MLGLGGLLGKREKNPDGFSLEKDYRQNQRIKPNYEKLSGASVSGKELDEVLRQHANKAKSNLHLVSLGKIQKKLEFLLDRVHENTLSMEPRLPGQESTTLKRYDPLRFYFEIEDNRYTFDTSVFGKANNSQLYILEKPSKAYKETVPYKGFKTEDAKKTKSAKVKFNGREVVELGRNGLIFTSNDNHPLEEKIEEGRLYLPDFQTNNNNYSGGKITIPSAVVKYKKPNHRAKEIGVEFTGFKDTSDKKKYNDFLYALKRAGLYT